MNKILKQLLEELKKMADPDRAQILKRFFKTEAGDYAAGDKFLGIYVPVQRKIAKKFHTLPLIDIQYLLNSHFHEHRLIALVILMFQFKNGDEKNKKNIYRFYLKNYQRINNWDLVDISAPSIVGKWLLDRPKEILYTMARSNNLWKKRIAIISTFTFIRNQNFQDTFNIATILLKDKHDLIQKAVGWMLREVGNRNKKILIDYLDKYCSQMARVTLRYAIEKFTNEERKYYLICSKH